VGELAGQRIVLGVSGGIAAYKAADLTRRLREAGADVRVAMTRNALKFVGTATFQALSGHPVRSRLWDEAAEAAMGHIELARWPTRIVIAPATASVIARIAHGLADDLLATLCLATEAPIVIVPAMNRLMWANAATQANVAALRARGLRVLGPAEGEQACGEVGAGRMLEPAAIVRELAVLSAAPRLLGRRVLVSAGPTREDLDPVRYLGNRSSGRMGFALAGAAAAMGARVTLVAGPVTLPTPAGVSRIDVRSAAQMRDAVIAALPGQDVYLGAAAVADYAPERFSASKIKKTDGPATLRLVRTPDILAEVAAHAQRPRVVVGFAAETECLERHALEKLRGKGADMIAANDVSDPAIGFEGDCNALTVYGGAAPVEIARMPKANVARALMALVADRLEAP